MKVGVRRVDEGCEFVYSIEASNQSILGKITLISFPEALRKGK